MIESIKKAVLGDNATETIKAGTLVTTRGIGVVLVALIGGLVLLDQFDYGPWKELVTWQKFTFVTAGGFIWSIAAGTDAIARGISAGAAPHFITIPTGLRCTYLVGEDSADRLVAAARLPTDGINSPEFLIVKGATHQWAKAAELRFTRS